VFGGDSSLCIRGDVKAIEVTAYATSNGNSENLREVAFQVAEDKARGKLQEFIEVDIKTSRVTNTLTKNVEKANDRIKQRISNGEEVAMSDSDADKETNFAVRENSNDVARQITDTIRVNSAGIQRGVRTIDEKIVDRQTVQVTIRWDRDSYQLSNDLKSKFSARN
jgi:predicted nucleic acid-binding protein